MLLDGSALLSLCVHRSDALLMLNLCEKTPTRHPTGPFASSAVWAQTTGAIPWEVAEHFGVPDDLVRV